VDDLGREGVALASLDEGALLDAANVDAEYCGLGNVGSYLEKFFLVEENLGGNRSAAVDYRGYLAVRAKVVELALRGLSARSGFKN
jgi:hypothetical protein